MLKFLSSLMRPSTRILQKRIVKCIERLTHYRSKNDRKHYEEVVKEAEFLLRSLPLEKIIGLKHYVDEMSISVTNSEFDHFLFYVIGEGSNLCLSIQITLAGETHCLHADVTVKR